jgi:Spy/CpxP family protein refolding chaperone
MKKVLLLTVIGLIVSCPIACANNNEIPIETEITNTAINKGDYTPQLIEKIKNERNTIYNALNLTNEQIIKKDEIESRRYKDLEPEIQKLCLYRQKLKDISKNNSNEKATVKSVQKDLETAKKSIKNISNKYDKEFRKILNSEQKSKYSMIRKLKRADLKKLDKKQKETSLRPFGVPISQAEYTKQQKGKHKLFKRSEKNDKE